jgi:gamma-glutamyltranspeptidase/glutathione hydrolase
LSGAPGTGDQARRARGLLVTTQQLAADAGSDLLGAGGSAVDAIVAAAFALCVVDPSNCGIGGYGGFLVYDPGDEAPTTVEFNTWMPSRLDPSQLRRPGSLGPATRGGLGVAPPAVVPGLLEAHTRFGRRPRAEVLEPAIRLARDGFPVGPYLAWALEQHLAHGGAGRGGDFDSLFYPGGVPLARGSTLTQSDLADTLEAILEGGAEAVQSGAIPAAVCESVVTSGGVLIPDDLAQDHVSVGPATTATFAGATVYGPSSAVSGAGILFPALDAIDPARLGANRGREYVAAIADGLRRAWTMRIAECGAPASHPHTTHLCAAGPGGDLATLTFTHGPWFGSDLIAAGTGIVLNGGANILAPSASGGRAVTNMAPLVLDDGDGARHALGAAGGPRIPALLLSAVVDVVCYGASLGQAVASPHISVRAADGSLEVEPELRLAGRPAEALILGERDFGPICGITRLADGYLPAVDRRFESGLAYA